MEGNLLRKGANVSLLSRSDPSARLQAVVRWSDPRGAADVDVSALLLGSDGRVRSDEDFVFYNSPSGGDGSVRLLGKRAEDEAGEDRVAVDLEALPSDVERVVIAASLDAGEGVGFGTLPELGLVLLDAEGSPSVRFDIDDVGPETAIVLGELYSRGDDWKFRAVGQGWDSGLAGLATDFGISVAAEAPEGSPAPDAVTVHEVPPVVAPPSEEPAADLVEVPVEEIGVDELVDGESWPATDAARSAPAQQPSGVRTRKKRALVTGVAPLTLAESASWHPARLFSVTGVGNAHEQEQRATSTLLSSMMAVRDFGRALVGRFGGPAGTIEAYPEVPFPLADDTTVRPDQLLPVLPRALAANPAARTQAAAMRLAAEGTLSTTLRSPRTAGPLTVTADLRTAQIRTSIEVDALRDGGSGKRVNWLLRQLANAPASATVEATFARRGQTACELLEDVRVHPAVLLPEPSADVKSFRIALCAPMGPKRSGQKQAFVPSVNPPSTRSTSTSCQRFGPRRSLGPCPRPQRS